MDPQSSLASTVPGAPLPAKETTAVPDPETPAPPVVPPEAALTAPDEFESEVGDSASAAPPGRSGGRDPNYFKLLANISYRSYSWTKCWKSCFLQCSILVFWTAILETNQQGTPTTLCSTMQSNDSKSNVHNISYDIIS